MITSLMFAAGCVLAAAAAAEGPLPPLPEQRPGAPMATMPFSQLAPGAHGVCYTVFEGDAVEPFAFVVKSVMPKFLGPDDDLLLVRLLGQKPEFTGVVSGMSGSPCLVDGKLIGALSYSFANFAKEPIAGITPIAAMTRTENFPQQNRPYRLAQGPWQTTSGTAWPSSTQHSAVTHQVTDGAEAWPPGAPADADLMPAPIATPLGLGNMDPRVRAFFAPYLSAMGFVPVATGVAGATDAHAPTAKLTPGSAIAVILAQGDINIAATGTVTAVHDKSVLAFGHPFTGGGAVSFPMATSRIINTMASSMHSFKMAIAGPPVGEIHDDRLPAIAGTVGAVPRMVPVTGTLTTPQGQKSFAFEVARDASLTPRIAAMGAINALTNRAESSSRGTGRLTATISVAGHDPITTTFVEAQQNGGLIFMQPGLKLYDQIAALWHTDFPPPKDISIALVANLAAEPVEETIQDITFDRSFAKNGGQLQVAVHLRGMEGQMRREHFKLPVPPRWSGEQLQVVAAGGHDAAQFLRQLQGAPNPLCYGDILAQLRHRPQEGELYLFVLREGQTLLRGGRSFGALPPSALTLLGQSPSDTIVSETIDFRGHRHVPGAIRGLMRRSLHVQPSSHIDRQSKAAKDL